MSTAKSAPPTSESGTPPRSYWIGVVSRDHVAIGVAGGFTQLNHGKAGPLERMQPGDGFVFYSPREAYPDGAPLQAFTAIGRIAAGPIVQADVASSQGVDFKPFRRAVDYLPAHEAPIKPLLDALTFIRSKTHWGAAFRFGIARVPEEDFARITAAMGRDFAADFPPSVIGASSPPIRPETIPAAEKSGAATRAKAAVDA